MIAALETHLVTGVAETALRTRLCEAVDGEFEILGLLGHGGMGAVYRAREHALQRDVAIKVLLPGLLANGASVVRFHQEARTAAALDHPNIIPIYAVREVGDLVFMVMRYVEGKTLEAVLHCTGRLPLGTARSILHQVGRALGYAHRRGVVHRDVKPANILIDHGGWALLGDFGIAKAPDGPTLTMTGTTVGTPFYMSPEACSEVVVTPASDQYSLGVVAYEMLAGHPPFRAASVAAAVKQHLFDTPPPLDAALPGLPHSAVDAVMRMLEKKPERRWPRIEDAIDRIGTAPPEGDAERTLLIEVLDRGDRAPDRGAKKAPRVARARWAGLALLVVAAIAGVTLGRREAAPAPVTLTSPDSSPPRVAIASLASHLGGSGSVAPGGRADTAASVPQTEPADTAAPAPRQEPLAERPAPAGARGDRTARTTAVSQPAAPEPAREGALLLGTRGLSAVLYVNGEARGAISQLRAWPAPAGPLRLEIRATGCQPWDSTVVVVPGDTLRIGYRKPECEMEGGS